MVQCSEKQEAADWESWIVSLSWLQVLYSGLDHDVFGINRVKQYHKTNHQPEIRKMCVSAAKQFPLLFSRFVTMEGLMQRLERAVTRLEQMSVTMQAPNGMANGGCVNGIDEGKSVLKDCLTQRFRGQNKTS